MQLVIKSVEMDGGLIYFVDGKHGLVREKEQSIVKDWVVGDRVNVCVADPPVFRMDSVDTGDVAHILLYANNEQMSALPED